MKIFLIAILFISSFALIAKDTKEGPYDQISIISDFDDTIKITHVSSKTAATYNGLFRTALFSQMDELFRNIVPAKKNFYLITGSPKMLARKIEQELEEAQMPKAELYLKKTVFSDTIQHKLKNIRAVLKKSSDQFILIGDDTESDADIFLEIKKEYPNRILAIYIHSVIGKKISSEVNLFMTAYEIASAEHKAGRLSKEVLEKVEEGLLNAKEKEIIPHFMSCEKLHLVKKKMSESLAQRINEICLKKAKTGS